MKLLNRANPGAPEALWIQTNTTLRRGRRSVLQICSRPRMDGRIPGGRSQARLRRLPSLQFPAPHNNSSCLQIVDPRGWLTRRRLKRVHSKGSRPGSVWCRCKGIYTRSVIGNLLRNEEGTPTTHSFFSQAITSIFSGGCTVGGFVPKGSGETLGRSNGSRFGTAGCGVGPRSPPTEQGGHHLPAL